MSTHGIPFHCPYCGNEDLRPSEEGGQDDRSAWECRACLRAFSLRMLGMVPRRGSAPTNPPPQLSPRGGSAPTNPVPASNHQTQEVPR